MKETRFKQTDIGLVPEDWEVTTLGESCEMPTDTIASNLFDHHLYISTDNLLKNCQGAVPYEGAITINRVREYRAGDSLVSNIRPNLHKTFYAKQTGGCSTDVIVLRPKEKLDSRILYAIICNQRYAATVAAEAVGTKMPRGDKNTIRSYTFAIPKDLSEQQRIAEMLSRVDELLVRLDKLIAKKQAVKQGTMQQLLTGRTRLKGFNEPWKETFIKDLGYTYTGLSGKTKNDFWSGQSQYITFLNVLNNCTIDRTKFEAVDVNLSERQNAVFKGDLFFNTSSETPEEVGMCSTLLEDVEDVYLNSFCFGFRLYDAKKVDSLFMAYWFRSQIGRNLMTELAQGSTRFNLSKENFLKSRIFIPPFDEQRAIARILTHMDKEIDALQVERRKVEQIKKGMMQQLLTGRIRLSV